MNIFKKILDKFPNHKSMYTKIALTVFFLCIFIIVVTVSVTNHVILSLETNLISDRLVSDIHYIEDLLRTSESDQWKIKDDALYFGDTLLGDGTQETANIQPFLKHEKQSGTFAYVFMLDKDAKLGYVKGTKTTQGYTEGHYLRIAGSTKDPNGNSIVGTYMTKNIADALDKNGTYSGNANVAGGMIYCLYNTLLDKEGNIVGAIVVGRNTTEVYGQIRRSVFKIVGFVILATLISFIFIHFLTNTFISSVQTIVQYLNQIESGEFPEKPLELQSSLEVMQIADSVNSMTASLKENVFLKVQSETDSLTGLPNRFSYDHYTTFITNHLLRNPQTLAVEILDVDYYKQFNDLYGHPAGDACLKKVSSVIKSFAETENIFACRYGGDEFVIIYNGFKKEEVEKKVLELDHQIKELSIEHRASPECGIVTISQGICFSSFKPAYSIDEFLQKADAALYQVKKNGRCSYIFADF